MENTGSKSAHDKTDQQKENESIIAAHKEADKDSLFNWLTEKASTLFTKEELPDQSR